MLSWWPAVLTAGCFLLLPAAAAQADFTWSGAGTGTAPSKSYWSNTGNWSGGTAPTSGADLVFPSLTSADCTSAQPSGSCYTAWNDLTSFTANSLTVDDNDGYDLQGNAVTVGSGGITAQSSGSGNLSAAEIDFPMALSAEQTWTFNGAIGVGGLDLTQNVTGETESLAIDFAQNGLLEFARNVEVGPFTASVTGTASNGLIDLYSDSGSIPSLNGTNGQPITLNSGIDLDAAAPGSSAGPITSNGAHITVGGGNTPDGTLAVDQGLTLKSGGSLLMYIDQNGTAPSTDFSQLISSANVTLDGSLNVAEGFSPNSSLCGLTPGDRATLLSTTGALTGTFSNVANQGLIPMSTSCSPSAQAPAVSPDAQITYSTATMPRTVSAMVVTPTATTVAANPSTPATNQTVTLTATVTPTTDVGGPSQAEGTVEFDDNGGAIPGCMAQPVAISGTGFAATCQTTFQPGNPSPSLTATYTAPGNSGYQSSPPSSAVPLQVGRDSTSTTVAASDPTPQVEQTETLTATVTPADSGSLAPSGQVEFSDNGTPLVNCEGQSLSGSTASCTTSLPIGTHVITAAYGGDSNFESSTSAGHVVSVSSPPPPPVSQQISATTKPATTVQTTGATLHGVVNTVGAAVRWQFEYGHSNAYNQGTAWQTIRAGQGSVAVSATLSKLAANAIYHYALVVMQSSPELSASGSDLTFTTPPNGRLTLATSNLAVSGTFTRVPAQCNSAVACAGRFLITTAARPASAKKSSAVRCATASYRVRAHKRGKIGATLSGPCMTLLRATRHGRLVATFSSRPQTGQATLNKRIALVLK